MSNVSAAEHVGQMFEIRRNLADEIEVGWLDYLDETRPEWRTSTSPESFACPMPRRALELAAERILANYDMKDVNL